MKPDDILKYFNIWTFIVIYFLTKDKSYSLEDWYFYTYDNAKWADITDGVMWLLFYVFAIITYGAVAQSG